MGNSRPVFLGVTVVLHGGAALATGRALAAGWRPWWQAVGYSVLLGASARFLSFALFEGALLSLSGFLISSLVLIGFALLAYRATWTANLVRQYPWVYERRGPLFVTEKPGSR
ncbi:MAG: DUF6867 family protein [Pseudomonadota bacterium]